MIFSGTEPLPPLASKVIVTLLVTVTCAVAVTSLFVPVFAVMVTEPLFLPVTIPFSLTVAIEGSELSQVIVLSLLVFDGAIAAIRR